MACYGDSFYKINGSEVNGQSVRQKKKKRKSNAIPVKYRGGP
jgi:hypothetical protein